MREECLSAFNALAFLSRSNSNRLAIYQDQNLWRKMLNKINNLIEDTADPDKKSNYLKFLAQFLEYNVIEYKQT